MAFRPEPTIYKLVFEEDTGLAGLTVRVKSCSMGEFQVMLRGGTESLSLDEIPDVDENDPASVAKAMAAAQKMSAQAAAANDEALQMFAKYLVEWDLADMTKDDDSVVPATLEGVMTVEKPIIIKIIGAWQSAMLEVSRPLKGPSQNGRRSEEASLGLGSTSVSQPNSSTPNS